MDGAVAVLPGEAALVAQALGERGEEAVWLPILRAPTGVAAIVIWRIWEGETLDEVLAEAAERLESDLDDRAKRRSQGE